MSMSSSKKLWILCLLLLVYLFIVRAIFIPFLSSCFNVWELLINAKHTTWATLLTLADKKWVVLFISHQLHCICYSACTTSNSFVYIYIFFGLKLSHLLYSFNVCLYFNSSKERHSSYTFLTLGILFLESLTGILTRFENSTISESTSFVFAGNNWFSILRQ